MRLVIIVLTSCVVAFYNPDNPALRDSATTARGSDPATRNRAGGATCPHGGRVARGLRGLKAGEVDAILVWDARVGLVPLLPHEARPPKHHRAYARQLHVRPYPLASPRIR